MQTDRPAVLIVDDEPLNLQHLAEILDADYQVKVALGGAQALELARRAPYPEVILLDVMMPEMDGHMVCEALKADPLTAAIPVIFITAKTDADSETAALRAGAMDFIHKPINPEVVRARMRLHHELAQHRHHLETLVQARTQELVQARDAAESANRAKTAFLRNASHEMRTPLHHITGMVFMLRKTLPEACDQARLDTLDQAAQRLLDLVTELLDLTCLEAGELQLEPRQFEPRTLLEQAIASHQSVTAAKGLSLLTSVDTGMPEALIGDPDRLRQILVHLLDNAVKFSERGEIRIQMHAGARQGQRLQLEVTVSDQGSGLEQELAARLFQPFQSGDESSTRQHAGLGLGLALCQRLVELMLGEIELTSAPGQGTSVTFRIPLTISKRPAEEI